MADFTSPEAADIAGTLMRPADEFVNDPTIEELWATQAYRYAETHFNLLQARAPAQLKLTNIDDQIYEDFHSDFPEFSLNPIVESELKSDAAKVKWREFCNRYKTLLNDFDTGTLLRIRAEDDYTEDNTIFVMRVQFFAVEIARNRSGKNDSVHARAKTLDNKASPPTNS